MMLLQMICLSAYRNYEGVARLLHMPSPLWLYDDIKAATSAIIFHDKDGYVD